MLKIISIPHIYGTYRVFAQNGKDAISGYYLYHIKALDFRGNIHYYKGPVYLIK